MANRVNWSFVIRFAIWLIRRLLAEDPQSESNPNNGD